MRLGDSLIGSAVVGLSVLRGNFVPGGKGLGLREIDGWYHVLDDLRRPQGQLKVRSRTRAAGGSRALFGLSCFCFMVAEQADRH